jgi:hypothetical protein
MQANLSVEQPDGQGAAALVDRALAHYREAG